VGGNSGGVAGLFVMDIKCRAFPFGKGMGGPDDQNVQLVVLPVGRKPLCDNGD